MKPAHPRHGRRTLGVLLHRWHRRIGLAAALFLGWLAVSGLALNESTLLKLDTQRLSARWLMRLYGLDAPEAPRAFSAEGHWLGWTATAMKLDGRPLQPPIDGPLGMVLLDGLLYVLTADSLVMLKPQDGSRVDVLRAPVLPPPPFRRIGLLGNDLMLDDGDIWLSADGESWSRHADAHADEAWSQPQSLPAAQYGDLAPSLPASRVLADLHSGRILGGWGARFVDAVGIAALLLSLSGVWAALRRPRR